MLGHSFWRFHFIFTTFIQFTLQVYRISATFPSILSHFRYFYRHNDWYCMPTMRRISDGTSRLNVFHMGNLTGRFFFFTIKWSRIMESVIFALTIILTEFLGVWRTSHNKPQKHGHFALETIKMRKVQLGK